MKKKLFSSILFIGIVVGCIILPNSCRTEVESENVQQGKAGKASQSVLKIKDAPLFKNFISTHQNSFITKSNSKFSNSFISLIQDDNWVKEIKSEDNITYSFYNYNKDKSFDILVYVYNTKDETDFSFISKFTPQFQDRNITVIDFTGKIDYIDEDGNLMGTTYRTGGRSVEGNSGNKNATGVNSKSVTCDWYLTETPHQCTEGGSHWPWQAGSCTGNDNTLPYWEVGFQYICTGSGPKRAEIANIGLDGGGTSGSGGNPVYGLASYDGINYMLASIGLQSLTIDQYNFLKNNPTISNYFRDFLFAQTNIDNSNFVKWGIDYLKSNSIATAYFNSKPQDLDVLFMDDLDLTNAENIEMANSIALVSTDLLINNKNNTLPNLETSWVNWDSIKDKIKDKFINSRPKAVKYGRYVYSAAKKVTDRYPSTLYYANKGIDKLRNEVHNEGLINYDVHTMKWRDIVGCWLFELGDYPINTTAGYGNLPTLGFAGADYVISGIPNQLNQMRYLVAHKTLNSGLFDENSIMFLRKQTIDNIKIGKLDPNFGEWHFGSAATFDTIMQLDGLQFCLGSYQTTVTITFLGNNQYKLTFVVKNKTGWTSGTRGLNDGDGNPNNDSVIPDKPRGSGLHLGGTIGQTYGWYEIVTIP